MVNTFMTEQIRREVKAQLARKGMTQQKFAEKELSFGEVQFSRMMAGSSEGSVKAWREIFEKLDLELFVVQKSEGQKSLASASSTVLLKRGE
jgi:hypothetical protein